MKILGQSHMEAHGTLEIIIKIPYVKNSIDI
jgi:hypothetical protein